MTRLKALQISMIVFGAFYLIAPVIYVGLAPDALKWAPFSPPYENLLVAFYAALGVCLLMAAKRPLSNMIIIDFTILSSIFTAASLTYNALTRPGEAIHLFADIPIIYLIAIIFILLYPRKLKASDKNQFELPQK